MDGGYPLQMDFSLSSSSKRFWDLWSGHGCWFLHFGSCTCSGWSEGEILRGELSGMERVEWRRFVCECVCEREGENMLQWSRWSACKNPHRGAWTHGPFLRRLPASALLRSPLILPTWTLVHHNLHANRLTQYAKIIQPAQDWQWSHKSLNGQGKIPPQNPD